MSSVQSYRSDVRSDFGETLFDTRASTVLTVVTIALYCGVFGLCGYAMAHGLIDADPLSDIFFAR